MSSRAISVLYHLAEEVNLASILRHGLLSTETLLALADIPDVERLAALHRHRTGCVTLPNGVLIRDQKPMPPAALAPALDDGLVPADWYALLNSFVFLWPEHVRLDRQRRACGDRPQAVLVFDAAPLFRDLGRHAFVSPINSGNARRRAARRGRHSLLAYDTWAEAGWSKHERTCAARSGPPAEVLFKCPIPARPPYLIRIERETASAGAVG